MLDEIESDSVIFIDSNIFLYVILSHPRYRYSCKRFLERVDEGDLHGLTSVLVCNEVVHKLMIAEVVEKLNVEPKSAVEHIKKNYTVIGELKKAWNALEVINQIENLRIEEIDRQILMDAVEFSKKYGLLSNDAFHVAVMKKYGVKNIATNDKDFERVDWIKVWKP